MTHLPRNSLNLVTGILLRSPYLVILLLVGLLGAFWLHALQIPFWQDDFVFLWVAREAREAGDTWLSVFWPAQKSVFWRPLSEGLYWRIVEGVFNSDPVAAHAINLALLVAASLAVAWLAAEYAPLISPKVDPQKAFFAAGFLYGIHAAHLVPVIWATAVHSSMVVLFSALGLRFWVSALRTVPEGFNPGLLSVPLFLLLALFSKENAILALPLGALLTAVVWNRLRPTRAAWVIAAVSAFLALIWLLVRQRMVLPPTGAYEMGIGVNTLRNLASMAVFSFNVPRESLRFMLEQQAPLAALWALACALLQGAAFWMVVVAVRSRLSLKGGLAVLVFFIVAGAPYLLFAWNAYAYYAALGLIVWPFLAVLAPLSGKRVRLVLGVALLSSGLSVAGNYALDYPALLARADWAKRQLEIIRNQFPAVANRAHGRRIDVVVENRHKFLGIGVHGLAFTLDLPPERFRVVAADAPAPGSVLRLIVPDQGNVRFE